MSRRMFTGAVCAVLCCLAPPALAQSVPDAEIVTYTTLGMSQPLHGSIVDVQSDATNRVWAVAPVRVSATRFNNGVWERVPLLPIGVEDTPLPVTARFRSLAFAVPAGNAGDGEHFFLGSSSGISWGRLAATVDHRGTLRVDPDAQPPVPEDIVNELDTDGGDRLWAATDGGVALWDLTSTEPSLQDVFLDGAGDGPIQHLAVAPWGAAAAVDDGRAYLVTIQGTASLLLDLGTDSFRGITFDAIGNLWAVATASGSSIPQVLKFESDGVPGTPGTRLTGVVRSFPLNPFVATGAPAGFRPTDIAVDPFTGRVWVTTASNNQGPMTTAYFQDPVDAFGNLQTDPGVNNWGVVSSVDRHTVVHTDSAGNAWFGMAGLALSPQALNGYIVRLLQLDRSLYLGSDTGVASLTDLVLFGDNGSPGEQTTLTIALGADSRPFTVTEVGDTGRFTQPFQMVPAGAAGGTGNQFLVSSSAADVPVQASYAFTDANNQPQELTASASWANIVSFEDDLWIGGPCFLRSLGW